jgi:thiamine kinase-like enzyme
MFDGWKSDVSYLMKRLSHIAIGSGSLYLFRANSRLAIAIPSDRRAAKIVVELYQPHRWKGRFFRILAKWVILFGIPKLRPTFVGSGIVPLVSWLREAAAAGTVGFLGCNPNHGPRCVLAGIDPKSGAKFIAKLGLDESAHAIRNEGKVLERLSGRYPGVIQVMDLQTADTDASRRDPELSYDWALLRLPHMGHVSPRSMSDLEVCGLLNQWLGSSSNPLGMVPWIDKLLQCVDPRGAPANWHERMRALRISTALLHGDFAVWNLRSNSSGLVAIDWEWGREDGIGGIDLAHGLRQECYMVRGMNPTRSVAWMLEQASSPTFSLYLKRCGWDGNLEDWLRLGLLHSHFNALNPSRELLAVLGIELNS